MGGKAKRLLLIDDSRDFLEAVGGRLVASGFEVVAADSGEEGVAAAIEEAFDLILLDMIMPEQDGIATYQQLRMTPKHRTVPIIMLTGMAREGRWESNDTDPQAFTLGKPYDHAVLLGRINEVLTRASGGLA